MYHHRFQWKGENYSYLIDESQHMIMSYIVYSECIYIANKEHRDGIKISLIVININKYMQ